jgi:hypothetical protein
MRNNSFGPLLEKMPKLYPIPDREKCQKPSSVKSNIEVRTGFRRTGRSSLWARCELVMSELGTDGAVEVSKQVRSRTSCRVQHQRGWSGESSDAECSNINTSTHPIPSHVACRAGNIGKALRYGLETKLNSGFLVLFPELYLSWGLYASGRTVGVCIT